MKLFVFEPFKWDYCGGAIVAIAANVQEVAELVWQRQKEDHERSYPGGRLIGRDDLDYSWEARKENNKERFLELEPSLTGNCWKVTQELIIESSGPELLCYNYNYA